MDKKVRTVTFIRHAESIFNTGEEKNLLLLKNCRLSKNGVLQASGLKGVYDTVILSPLKRAVETYVQSTIKVNKQLLFCPLVREHKNGLTVNMLDGEEEIDTKVETEEEFSTRIDASINFIKNLSIEYGQQIAVITHHDYMKALFKKITGKDIGIGNCGSYSFSINMP